MVRRRVVRAGELRAGAKDRFWLTAAGQSVLALLDDLSLYSLTVRLFDLGGPLLDARDSERIDVVALSGTRRGLPPSRTVEFASMPLAAAVLKAAGTGAGEVIDRSQKRMATVLEAAGLVRDFDSTAPGDMTPLFYAHAYNQLRTTVAELLQEFAGVDVDD